MDEEAEKLDTKTLAVNKIELSEADLKAVFSSLCEKAAAKLSKDAFNRAARICSTIVKPTIMSAALSISEDGSVGRLSTGDVVEVLEGPSKDTATNIMRVRCMSLAGAGLCGWVSTTSNQGTVFMKEGGAIFKVVKESTLTDEYDINTEKDKHAGNEDAGNKVKAKTGKAKVGDVLDLIEGPKKDPATGVLRIRCRVRGDGAVGWLTTRGDGGTVFATAVA